MVISSASCFTVEELLRGDQFILNTLYFCYNITYFVHFTTVLEILYRELKFLLDVKIINIKGKSGKVK